MLFLSALFFIFAILSAKYKEKKPKRLFFDAALFFIFGALGIIYFIANYFTGNGINETVLAALNLGLENAGFEEYIYLIIASLFAFVALFIAAFFYYHHINSIKVAKPQKIKAFLHNSFLVLAFLSHPALLDFKNLYQIITLEKADDFYLYYKTPDLSNLNSNKKNIVFIYAESLERTYFDTTIFDNLMPNLNSIIKDTNAIEFTNIVEASGANYTIAGMVSTQCAIPLYTTSGGNSMEEIDKFYPKAICMGDILKKEGYYLSFFQGSSLKFSGIGNFYKTHSFDTVMGKEELQRKLKNRKYLNGWGLYDDSLLDMAYDEFLNLSNSKEPFALFLHTIDTHHPKGHLSSKCKKQPYKEGLNEILNCAKCSDMLISEFIKKIKESKFANNTIIVITSDHLAMRNTASSYLEKSKNRRNLFVVIDPSATEHKSIDKIGSAFDITPTVLSFLGIKLDIGLGRNLTEQESIYNLFENFDKKLNQWREDILTFWQFPKIPDNISINPKKETLKFGETTYKLPVLMKIENKQVQPYFEYNNAWKLYEQLQHFKDGEKFLWVDKCEIMNNVFELNQTTKYCIAEGSFGVNYKVKDINNITEYRIDTFDKNTSASYLDIKTLKNNIEVLKNNGVKYKAALKDTIVFKKEGYPSFLQNIEGLSFPQEVGRWSDAWLHPSIIFTFKETLAKKFKFEIVLQGHKELKENRVQVKVGDVLREFNITTKEPQKITLEFDNITDANAIEIIPPHYIEPNEDSEDGDYRKLSLLFISMKITPLF